MSNRVMILAAALGFAAALTIGSPAAAEVVYLNPATGQAIPVAMPASAAPTSWVSAPSSWPWGWTTPSTLPWTLSPGTTMAPATMTVPAPTVAPGVPYGVTVAGMPAPGYVYAPQVYAPQSAMAAVPPTGYQATPGQGYLPVYAEAAISLDRLIASAETADEIRILLSRSDRLRQARADNLTRTFLKERIVNAEVARTSGLSLEYLGWIYDTLLEHGDRLNPSLFLPNFRLLPAASAASWTQVWSRGYAALYTAQAWGRSGLATVARTTSLRAEASSRGTALQRLNPGTQVAVAGAAVNVGGSSWIQARSANGFTGWINASDLSASFVTGTPGFAVSGTPVSSLPYAGPESVILWQDHDRVPAGHDSAYGWVFPQYLQNAEAQHAAPAQTSR